MGFLLTGKDGKVNEQTMQAFLHGKIITKFEVKTYSDNSMEARISLGDMSYISVFCTPRDVVGIDITDKSENPDYQRALDDFQRTLRDVSRGQG